MCSVGWVSDSSLAVLYQNRLQNISFTTLCSHPTYHCKKVKSQTSSTVKRLSVRKSSNFKDRLRMTENNFLTFYLSILSLNSSPYLVECQEFKKISLFVWRQALRVCHGIRKYCVVIFKRQKIWKEIPLSWLSLWALLCFYFGSSPTFVVSLRHNDSQ